VFAVVIFLDFYTFRNWHYLILQNVLSSCTIYYIPSVHNNINIVI